jgi:hypothetical protein
MESFLIYGSILILWFVVVMAILALLKGGGAGDE